MKRSEAVNSIVEILCWSDNLNLPCTLGSNFELLANEILSKLEERGVNPPLSASIEQVNILDKWNQDTGKTQYMRVIKPLWDKEDE